MKVTMNDFIEINKNNYLHPMIQSLNTTYPDGNPDLDLGAATKSMSLKITKCTLSCHFLVYDITEKLQIGNFSNMMVDH